MRGGTPAVLLLLIASLAAGCLGGDTETETQPPPQPDPPQDDDEDVVEALDEAETPHWFLGDWWRYRVEPDNGPSYTVPVVAVVRDGQPVIAVGDLESGHQALFRHFPPTGVVEDLDLTMSVHGDPVSYFNFPLFEGKSWTRDYRGTSLTYGVSLATIPVDHVPNEAFLIEARDAAENVWFRYTYSPYLAWFYELDFYRDGSPESVFRMTLEENGHGWSSQYYDLLGVDLAHGPRGPPIDPEAPGAPEEAVVAFTVGDPYTDLLVGAFMGGDAGVYRFTAFAETEPATQYTISLENTQPGSNAFHFEFVQAPATAGPWRAVWTVGGMGFVFGEVFGVDTTPRTIDYPPAG